MGPETRFALMAMQVAERPFRSKPVLCILIQISGNQGIDMIENNDYFHRPHSNPRNQKIASCFRSLRGWLPHPEHKSPFTINQSPLATLFRELLHRESWLLFHSRWQECCSLWFGRVCECRAGVQQHGGEGGVSQSRWDDAIKTPQLQPRPPYAALAGSKTGRIPGEIKLWSQS